jgi:RNA polymerase sigma factor (TIGR02999 family)
VTVLLEAAGRGDERAASDLLPLVYGELRKLADSWMGRTPPGQTLQATALVHEAFLRLVGKEDCGAGWENRGHFFFAAGRAMKDILVERARARARLKRGGDRRRLNLDDVSVAMDTPEEEMLVLHDAMERLEREHPWEHRIVTLRFFAGLTMEETAQAMGSSLRTIERDWRFAQAWLRRSMADTDTSPRGAGA